MDEAIAYGATIKASQLSGQDQENRDILLLDVTPLSLGLADVSGMMGVIVPKNSRIPLKITQPAVPEHDHQNEVIMSIYQGGEAKCVDNHMVGEFTMNFNPRRQMILMVTFEIDANGLLTVSAMDPETRKTASITITSGNLNLTDSEVK